MSLDVILEKPEAIQVVEQKIFIRRNGANVEISRAEWDELYPGREPIAAEEETTHEVYWANITHNLGRMAEVAGIYKELWRPEEIDIRKAHQLIQPLRDGLERLKANPAEFRKYNPPNGWGNYEGLVDFVEKYLAACEANPDADVSVWR